MLEEGLDELIKTAELMARCARKGLSELGFRLLSTSPANALTAAYPPSDISADRLRSSLEGLFGLKVAGGQGSLKGSIIRIAHLGYFDLLDVVAIVAAIEMCFNEMGKPVNLGSGVTAAMEEARSADVLVPRGD
jgi:aspartate aminotransferase-like enzyme